MSDPKSRATISSSSTGNKTTNTKHDYYKNDLDEEDIDDDFDENDDDEEEEDGGSSDVDFILNDETNNVMNNNNISLNIVNNRTNDADEEFKYEVLTPDKIVQHMIECIKEVNQVVEVCSTFLNNFK